MPDTTGVTPDLLLPLAIIWLAPAIWIFIDVRLRGGRAIVWATEWLIASAIALAALRPLIWLPANAIGLVVYLFVRPKARESLPDWRDLTNPTEPPVSAAAPERAAENGQIGNDAVEDEPPPDREREGVERDR
jgi:hypothetical protein